MRSWQATLLDGFMRAVVRRDDWGAPRALARRARLLFGAPAPYGALTALGVRRTAVHDGAVRGEWLAPPDPLPGVVLYVHGGGFVACSPASYRPVTAWLARHARRRVFAVDYRLAPEHPFPAAPDDVLAAYEWLHATGAAADGVAVAGDSAGGNLALGLAVRLRDAGRPAPACVVAISAWADLRAPRPDVDHDALFRRGNFAQFADAYLAGAPADDPRASPLRAPLGGLPPLLQHVGSTEMLLEDARRVHEGVRAAGGESRLAVYEGVPHGWQLLAPLVPEAVASLRDAADFVAAHLAPPRAAVHDVAHA